MPQSETTFRDNPIDLRWRDRGSDTKMTNGPLVLDGDHSVIYCSERVSALLGLGQSDIFGRGLEEVLRCRRIDDEPGVSLLHATEGVAGTGLSTRADL